MLLFRLLLTPLLLFVFVTTATANPNLTDDSEPIRSVDSEPIRSADSEPLPAFDSELIVLHDVNLLTMEDEQIREGYSVIIQDGVIQWAGPSTEADIPDDARIIRGEYYVMPGLSEMHAHIPSANQGEEAMRNTLALYLSYGLTTIRGMLGQPAHLELRSQAETGAIVSPRIITSGPSFSGNSVTDPEAARERVREQVEAGYDLLKFHPGLSLEVFEATVDEANRLGMEFSGHISLDVGLERSLAAGKGSIDHLDRYMEFLAGDDADRDDPPIIFFGYDLVPYADEARIAEAARRTADAGVWNVPTNTLLDNIFNPANSVEEMVEWPGMEFVPSNAREGWSNYVNQLRNSDAYDPEQAKRFLELRAKLTLALHEEGAGLMLGADAPQVFNPPGFSTHRELKLLVDAGLSPFDALKAGTVNVGKYLGEEDRTGKVAEGYRADLILLSVNPLENIPFHAEIEGVISAGDYLDRAAIDEILNRVRAAVD